ncbi:MAG: metallophosphoesterase [Bacteroidetes Order II. Incertae sedis bacterium]|nr:metallophosphoesterase [Bacteroidetes Order II. bacterium]
MKRRNVLMAIGAAASGLGFLAKSSIAGKINRGAFSQDGNQLTFYHDQIKEPFKVLVMADTHLFRDDDRGTPFKAFSGRMAKAYNQTRHVKTGSVTNPETCFLETLAIARQEQVAFVALLGDIFSFPSEAAIEWAEAQLKESQLPYVYVAGNHDWHYEGMEGSLELLRRSWVNNRLLRLYQGENPLMQVREVAGVQFVLLDNSYYEILPEQLAFTRSALHSGKPTVLMMHIPLYAMGRKVGYGCGHPDWNAQNDRSYQLERRERWPEEGHSATTIQFYTEVTQAPNVLATISGHIHEPTLDLINGMPSVVTDANARGGYLKLAFAPQKKE